MILLYPVIFPRVAYAEFCDLVSARICLTQSGSCIGATQIGPPTWKFDSVSGHRCGTTGAVGGPNFGCVFPSDFFTQTG